MISVVISVTREFDWGDIRLNSVTREIDFRLNSVPTEIDEVISVVISVTRGNRLG